MRVKNYFSSVYLSNGAVSQTFSNLAPDIIAPNFIRFGVVVAFR